MYIVFSRVIVKKLYLFFDYVAKIHILLIIHIAQALQFCYIKISIFIFVLSTICINFAYCICLAAIK